MKIKNIFLFLILLLAVAPFTQAATEDAIREVGYGLVGVIVSAVLQGVD